MMFKDFKGKRSVAPIMACAFPQFLCLAIGQWWLFIILCVAMILIYRLPWLYGRKGLLTAIISIQIANLIGGIAFYYFPDFRSAIVLTVGIFCLVFPLRRMVVIGFEMKAESKVKLIG